MQIINAVRKKNSGRKSTCKLCGKPILPDQLMVKIGFGGNMRMAHADCKGKSLETRYKVVEIKSS